MLQTIGSISHLIPALHGTRRLSPPARPPFAILRMFCEALQGGLAAHRHYEELRSKGLAHESALRQRSHSLPRPPARHAKRSRRCGLRARHRERRLRFSPWRSAETAAALRRAETCTSPQDSAPEAGGGTRFRDQPVKLPAVLGGFG
jgi:hypothetical protein